MNNLYLKLADFIIEIQNTSFEIKKDSGYEIEKRTPDMVIAISDDDIEYEIKQSMLQVKTILHESAAVQRKLAEWLPLHDAFILHAACFDVNGVGVAFAAHSGTGKTTHMNLWKMLLGRQMKVVNGDKPIIRFFPEQPTIPCAHGTLWNGKEHYGKNRRTHLQHICFIERSETNFVEPMEKEDAIDRMFNQVYMPKDPVAVMNTMQLIDRLLSCCKLWTIHCNMEPEAAEIAYKSIFADK